MKAPRSSRIHRILLFAALTLAAFRVPASGVEELRSAVAAGDWQEANRILATVSSELRSDPNIVLLQATAAYRQGRRQEAQSLLQALHERLPKMPEPLNNLAAMEAGSGRLDRALELLHEAMATHPAYESAYRNLGDVYARLAASAYAKALEEGEPDAGLALSLKFADRVTPPGRCEQQAE